MSRVFTSNTGTTRAGRGRAAPQNNTRSSNRVPGAANAMASRSPLAGAEQNTPENPGAGRQGAERRMEHRGAYSVIPPDEQKRLAIASNAKRETESYEKFKQGQKLGHVSYVGCVGGGGPQNPARAGTVPGRLTKPPVRKTQQQWKQDQRQSENAKADQHKIAQRQKAMHNAERDSARTRRLDEDRRQKTEAFLARLEHGKK